MTYTFSGTATNTPAGNTASVSLSIGATANPTVIVGVSPGTGFTGGTLTVGGQSATLIGGDTTGVTHLFWVKTTGGLSGTQTISYTVSGLAASVVAFSVWYTSNVLTLGTPAINNGTSGTLTVSVTSGQFMFAMAGNGAAETYTATETPANNNTIAGSSEVVAELDWTIINTNAAFAITNTNTAFFFGVAAPFTAAAAPPSTPVPTGGNWQPDFWEDDFIQEFAAPWGIANSLFQPNFIEPDFILEYAAGGAFLSMFEPGFVEPDFIENYAYAPQSFIQPDFVEPDFVQEFAPNGAALTSFQPDAWEPDFIQEYAYAPQTFVETDAWEPDFVQELAASTIADLRDAWFLPWSDPVRTAARPPYFEAAPYFETQQFPETVSEDRWHQPWSEPVRTLPRVPYFEAFSFDPKDFAPSMGWFQEWAPKPPPPPRSPEFPAAPYFETQQFPETVTESRWHQPWSEPQRFLSRVPYFEAFEFDPKDFAPSMGWFEALSEPIRILPRAPYFEATPYEETQRFPGLTQFVTAFETDAFEPDYIQEFANAIPVVPPDLQLYWFRALSEPVRGLPRSPEFPQPQFDPQPFVTTTIGTLIATERRDIFAGQGLLRGSFGRLAAIGQRSQMTASAWNGSVQVGVKQTFPSFPT